MAKKKSKETTSQKGRIHSSLEHPVTIRYRGENLRLSPRGVVKNILFSDLGPLPSGVVFVPGKE